MRNHLKGRSRWLNLVVVWFSILGSESMWAQTAPSAAPPPSAPAQRSAADLEKLVAPIALYPDPLIASVLPASAYPLEIVQAARFVKDTNNVAKVDEQAWDSNVKAVARFPEVIAQMDQNIAWTSDLGDAFINQPKELMDAVQTMRAKAQASGALKTTEQQVVSVTNTIVTNVVEQQTVYVTNEVVQIQPAQSQVIYVPQYNPTVVYPSQPIAYPGYYYPPAPAYYPGAMAAASIVSFGAGMAMGAWMNNGCNWGHGEVDINRNVNVNGNFSANRNVSANGGQKWQPDQNRMRNSGSASSSAQSREARGWGNGTGQTRNTGTRPNTANAGTRPSTGAAQNRASTGAAQNRAAAGGNRSGTYSPTGRTSSSGGGPARSNPSANRPSSSSGSAFSGSGNGAAARSSSSRGAASRSGGGGARGGGGGRRR